MNADRELVDPDLSVLRRIIARAADPHERAAEQWCRSVDTSDDVRAARRAHWIASLTGGDRAEFVDLLRRRGIDAAMFDRMISDVEVDVPMSVSPGESSTDHALPSWARGLGELVVAARRPVDVPPISLGEVLGADEVAARHADPDDPWPMYRVVAPLLAAPSRRVPELARRGFPMTGRAQRTMLVAAARRFAGVAVHTLTAPPAAFGDTGGALDLLDMSLLEIYFTDRSDIDAWLAVFDVAPTLGRVLGTVYSHWYAAAEELVDRLASDATLLSTEFAGGAPLGALRDLETDSGDLHRGGRAVQVLHFEHGTSIVYKPKNLEVGVSFLELLQACSNDTSVPSIEPRRLLARGDHTWEAFVERGPCPPDGVARFYRRYGMIARFVQALRGHDFTCENVLAAGEHPELIDLESLFRPVSRRADDLLPVERALIERWLRSVAGTSMIFAPIVADAGRSAADMSPLAPADEWNAPFRQPRLVPRDDGSVRVTWEYVPAPRANPVPMVEGSPVDPTEHLDDVLAGYEEMDALLADSPERVISALADFASTPVRFLNRSSHIYARLIGASLQPRCMRDGVAREISIDRLWKALRGDPYGGVFIGDEVDAVRQLDIPLLQGVPGSTEVILNDGSVVGGAFAEPALHDVVARLRAPDGEAVAMARTALGCIDIGPRALEPLVPRHDVGPDELIAGAADIGRLVAGNMVRHGDDVGWLGVGYHPVSDTWSVHPLGADLLNGTGGIAVALAEIADASGDAVVADAARVTLGSVLRRLAGAVADLPGAGTPTAAPSNPPLVGGLLGLGSVLHAVAVAATALGDSEACAALESLLHGLDPRTIAAHACDDLLGGRRGLAGNLRAVAGATGVDHANVLAAAVEGEFDPGTPIRGPYPEGSWALANLIVDQEVLPASRGGRHAVAPDPGRLPTRDLLDILDVASMVRWTSPPPSGEQVLPSADATACAGVLLARRETEGSWFPDLRFEDRHHLSATYGVLAVARALLAAAGAAVGPPLRAAPLLGSVTVRSRRPAPAPDA